MQDKSILVLAYGNQSRGDDAIALLLQQQIKHRLSSICGLKAIYLTDYQIQIEHVMDMQGCERVLLLDADQTLTKPYDFSRVIDQSSMDYTTHKMIPSMLLFTYRKVFEKEPPPTYLLALQGECFELNEPVTNQAKTSLNITEKWLFPILQQNNLKLWDSAL